jgi:flagellar biosynthetic protein FlhB
MPADDKTEKATPKKARESRKKGQVAKSTEINGAFVLVAGLIGVSSFGPKIVAGIADSMRNSFAQIAHAGSVTSGAGLSSLFQMVFHTVLLALGPIAGLAVSAALLSNVAQVGFRPSMTALKPNFKRLNPVAGAKNLFGPRIGAETLKALSKVAMVGAVAAMTLVPMIRHLSAGVGTSPIALGSLLASSTKVIVERVVVAYVLIALVDLVWQRKRHAKQLKMSKHEVKEEHKQTQLPPEVKSALRRRQIQAARARMMAAVPTADVVVTNPTHYAVALRYDGSKPAPTVVAKGKNHVATQIRRIADENGVPIVPDPPLARSLHAGVEIDHMIPAELYAAVAQVLAFVYKMAGRRRVAA